MRRWKLPGRRTLCKYYANDIQLTVMADEEDVALMACYFCLLESENNQRRRYRQRRRSIGGGAYWAGWATAAHFSVLVDKAYSLLAHFLWLKTYFFHNPATSRPMKCIEMMCAKMLLDRPKFAVYGPSSSSTSTNVVNAVCRPCSTGQGNRNSYETHLHVAFNSL